MSPLTQQLRPVVSSRALGDNTDENVALQSAADHPRSPASWYFQQLGEKRSPDLTSPQRAEVRSSQSLRPGFPINDCVEQKKKNGEERSRCPFTEKIPNICHVIRWILTIL